MICTYNRKPVPRARGDDITAIFDADTDLCGTFFECATANAVPFRSDDFLKIFHDKSFVENSIKPSKWSGLFPY